MPLMTLNNRMCAGMPAIMQLMQAGRLEEATATIQRMLGGQPVAPGATRPIQQADNAPIEGIFQVINDGASEATQVRYARSESPRLRPVPKRAPDGVPGGQFIARAYTNQAGTRAYKLYVPSGYRRQTLPLVVMLHGCTQSPEDFAVGTRMNRRVEAQQMLVLYPAQLQDANTSKCWNWFKPGDQRRNEGEPSIIAGMTREVMHDYEIDPQRVYIAGLSAGGAMAVVMGMTYPELYAAVGAHSGLPYAVAHDLPSAFAMMREGDMKNTHVRDHRTVGSIIIEQDVPTIVFHGDRDTTVHPGNSDRIIAQSRAVNGADVSSQIGSRVFVQGGRVANGHAYTRTVYRDANGQPSFEHWLVHGAGHAWSGGSSSGSFTDPKGPDATREMIRFFLEHPQLARH
jgi:poly(hydroxyalkanoate) depolymerase family esterase